MTLRLIEGFDHFDPNTNGSRKGWNAQGDTRQTISQVAGRVNGEALQINSTTGDNRDLRKVLPSTYTTAYIGFAIYPASQRVSDNIVFKIRASDNTTDIASVCITSADKIRVKNSGGTTIATGSASVVYGNWNYVELKLVINGASGQVTTQLNGSPDIAATTGNFGSTAIGAIGCYSNGGAFGSAIGAYKWDDIYVLDTAGSAPVNTFLGDVHVETLLPNGVGTHSDWTPNSGSTHYDRVSQALDPDDDTTYLADATVNDVDSFAYPDLAILLGTVFAIQTNLWARKDDATLRQIKALIRSGGADYVPGAAQTLSTSYADYTDIQETDPATSAAWTISGVNAAEFGVKVVT